MRQINWRDDSQKFALFVGGREVGQWRLNCVFGDWINNTFAKYPKVRAEIWERLYFSGMFDDFVEGWGLVTAIDRDKSVAYFEQINKDC